MDNKFDPYENFDPTQESGSACGCNGIYWDIVTQTWRKRIANQPTKPDCSELEKALEQAKTELSSATTNAEEKQSELDKANARVAELEKQLAEQPTVCDVLKANLRPVQRLNGEVAYYVPNETGCEGFNNIVSDLSGDTIHNASGDTEASDKTQ